MAFTYDPTTGSTRDLLRLTIGDTDTVTAARQIFTNEELDALIAQHGSDLDNLAGHCMETVANSMARIAVMCAIGSRDFVNDRKNVASECREQAKYHFNRAKTKPYATEVALEDPDITHVDDFIDVDSQEIGLDDVNTP